MYKDMFILCIKYGFWLFVIINGCFNVYVMWLFVVEFLLFFFGISCFLFRWLYILDMDFYEEKLFFLLLYRKVIKLVLRFVLFLELFIRIFNGYKKIFCKYWYFSVKLRYFEKLCLESFVFVGNNFFLCFNNMFVFLIV